MKITQQSQLLANVSRLIMTQLRSCGWKAATPHHGSPGKFVIQKTEEKQSIGRTAFQNYLLFYLVYTDLQQSPTKKDY